MEPLDSASGLAEIMALSPVSFAYKPEIGIPGTPVGFIAEQVQTIDPRLVVLDASGTPFTVRYENLTAILAKATQEIATISGAFRTNLIAWLGNAGNGIHDLYAGTGHTNEVDTGALCAQKSDGTQVCLTGDQLANLLITQGGGVTTASIAAPQTTTDATRPSISTATAATTDQGPVATSTPAAGAAPSSAPDTVTASVSSDAASTSSQ